jgi:3-(3-hydroxy-phenyl)propionate hydroxylase
MPRGPEAGAPAINRRIADNDYLLDHLGPGFTGLYFNEGPTLPDAVRELFQQLEEADQNFTAIVISPRSGLKDPPGLIEDPSGHCFQGYGAQDGTFYLLRPDRHIAARWLTINAREVKAALLTALGR